MLPIINTINSMLLVRNFLRRTEGKIFSVTFLKKSGEIRTMNCKVLRAPRVVLPTYTVLENNLLHKSGETAKSIRSFRADRVINMRCGSTIYTNSAVLTKAA